ncbi:MAG: ABC transporter substrate-binding protein [Candidatus Tectomicrobia bacterium]|nr:ABC transporter substrate-binding protein [Candidatus Tectomicrobia bacterium]
MQTLRQFPRRHIHAAFLITALLVALTLAHPGPVRAEKAVIGYLPIMGFSPMFVATELGYFAEQGFEPQLEKFRTGGDIIALLASGSVDVGAGSIATSLFNAIYDKLPIKVVGSATDQPEGYNSTPLLVSKALWDSGKVKRIADLKGMKVAINAPRGLGEYYLAGALKQGGLTIDDIDLTTMAFPTMPEALNRGAIAAAILPQPLASRAIDMKAALLLLRGDKITASPQAGVYYYGKNYLTKRDAGKRMMVALIKAHRALDGDTHMTEPRITAAIGKWTSLPPKIITSTRGYHFDVNGKLWEEGLADMQRYHVGRGYTKYKEPLPLSQMYDPEFLEAALAKLGRK